MKYLTKNIINIYNHYKEKKLTILTSNHFVKSVFLSGRSKEG